MLIANHTPKLAIKVGVGLGTAHIYLNPTIESHSFNVRF